MGWTTRVPAAERLSVPLCAASVGAALPSLVRPSLLSGEPVTTGNVRGTALIVLVLTVPLLLIGMRRARAGSLSGLALWVGATMALTYQGLLFCFGIPFNALFLPYVAMLGLGGWTLASLVSLASASTESAWTALLEPSRFAPRALAALALGNGAVWLVQATPTIWTGAQPDAIGSSGLLTSPVWVQDLAFWIPAAVLVSALALRGRAIGHLLTAGMLAFYAIECVSVASDQWFGARADDTRPEVASLDVVPFAVALGLLILVPLTSQLRMLDRATGVGLLQDPTAGDPGWRRTIGAVSALTGLAATAGTVQLVTGTYTPPVSDLRPLGLGSWALPGIWLAVTVALPCGVTAWRAWVGSAALGRTAAAAAALLLLELAVQIPFVGLDPLQAVMAAVAAVLIVLGFRSEHDPESVISTTSARHTSEEHLKHHIP